MKTKFNLMPYGFTLTLGLLVGASSLPANTLVATNSTWNYFKGTREASMPTNAWRELAFDASSWAIGSAPFHFGNNAGGGDDALTNGTILGDMRGNYGCVFLRQTFVMTETNDLLGLQLNVWVDDGLAVWLNGQRFSTPFPTSGSSVAYNARALFGSEGGAVSSLPFDAAGSALRLGTNVLCLQAFNLNSADPDFRIDAELILGRTILTFAQPTISVPETADVVTVQVRRSGRLDAETTAEWKTINGTAMSGLDFVGRSGLVRFAPGETVQLLTVPLLNDGLTESNEQFHMQLADLSLDALVRPSQPLTVTVQDNDDGFRLVASLVRVPEDAGNAVVLVRREADLLEVATVDWIALSNGLHQAESGLDFQAGGGRLTFGVGEREKPILIPINNDSLRESAEKFTVQLRPVSTDFPVLSSNSSTTVQIDSDDFDGPQNWYVWADSPNPTPPYFSWATAAHVIQDAVDIAWAGDTVLVTNGVYDVGGKAVGENRLNRVVVTNGVTLRSVNGAEVTTILGGPAPDGGNGPGATRCVYVGPTSTVRGFTLSGGHAYNGGGVWCAVPGRVSDCIIVGNEAELGGGASGEWGAIFERCRIVGNTARDSGGGAYGGFYRHCSILQNTAVMDGGGVAGFEMYNCVVAGNSAGKWGGGCNYGFLTHCTVVSNFATDEGGGLFDVQSVSNSIVWSNYTSAGPDLGLFSAEYSCSWPLAQGVGNIEADPLFVDPAGGDYRLRPNSPCIDAAFHQNVPSATDRDGFPRELDRDGNGVGRPDMGAFEYYPYRIAPLPRLTSEGLELVVRGGRLETLRVEQSRDLAQWEIVSLLVIPADGVAVFRSAAPENERPLFYRVVTTAGP